MWLKQWHLFLILLHIFVVKDTQTKAIDITKLNNVNFLKAIVSVLRCRKPENASVQTDVKVKWNKKFLTYKIMNTLEPFSKKQIKDRFERAIELWTENVNLSIVESKLTSADIQVYFNYIDGKGDSLGYAYFPENGDIFIDQVESWVLEKSDDFEKVDFNWVVAHEMGHSLGLNHNPNSNSIMNKDYIYNNDIKTSVKVEKNKLIDLYGENLTKRNMNLNNSELCSNASAKVNAMTLLTTTGEYVLIKGDNYWTFGIEGVKEGPFALTSVDVKIPKNIDAAFVLKDRLYFFRKNMFYKYYSTKRKMSSEKTISSGFPGIPDDLDDVFYNPSNGIIYFFKGANYHAFSIKNTTGVITRNIADDWKKLPDDIEAATVFKDEVVLFIKAPYYYLYNLSTKSKLHDEDLHLNDFFKCDLT